MESHDTDSLNFNKLAREVECAVDSDEKYWRENDAKFRAVHQKVATYDEFRNIVAASHLKPLDKGEKLEFSINKPWNNIATKSTRSIIQQTPEDKKTRLKLPKNVNEFVREWRKLTDDLSRFEYLKLIGAQTTTDALQSEVPFGILGEILSASLLAEAADVDAVLKTLNGLAKSKRFQLSLQFLNKDERNCRDRLFVKLSQLLPQVGDSNAQVLFESLFKLYAANTS